MKKILLTMTLITIAFSAYAQQVTQYDMTQGTYDRTTKRGPYLTNRFFDNFFFTAGGGVNMYMGEGDSKGGFADRLAPALDISVGKWVTPSVGLRVQYSGLSATGFSSVPTLYTASVANTDGLYKKEFDVMNIHADFLWDVSNAVGGYNETRVWSFVPFVGFGVAQSQKNNNDNFQLAATAGLMNKIRLGSVVDLILEAKYMVVKPEFDQFIGSEKFDGMASLTAGISIKFGPKKGFKRPTPPVAPIDVTPYLKDISRLEGQLSESEKERAAQKARVEQLNKELETAKNRPEPKPELIVVETSAPASMAVFFKINSYVISQKDMMNLENIAKYIKESPNKKFKVVGYADSSTGTPEINARISLQRAQTVADALVQKFGVQRSQLTVESKGGVGYESDPTLSRMVRIEQ